MDRLVRIEVFIRVVETGSFSAAARSLKLSQPSVSRAIADLEGQLGTRLLHRTTRVLSTTEAGAIYFDRMKRVLLLLEEAGHEANIDKNRMRGRLRINSAALLASALVMPAAVAFRQLYPAVDVQVVMDDRRIDLVEDGTDVAVRVGPLSSSALRVRRAGEAAVGIFGAPTYVAEQGLAPDVAAELVEAHLVRYIFQKPPLPEQEGGSFLSVSNGLLARQAALAGAGLAVVPHFLVVDDVDAERLVQVAPALQVPSLSVSLLHPFSGAAPHRVTAFIDFAIDLWRRSGLLHP